MSIDIYKEIILEHYKKPHNFGTLDDAYKAQVSNPLCGDAITIEVAIENKRIRDIRFNGQGCAIAIASASLLTDYALDKLIDDLTTLNKDSMLEILAVELSPNRLKCALVSLEALQKAIKSYGSST